MSNPNQTLNIIIHVYLINKLEILILFTMKKNIITSLFILLVVLTSILVIKVYKFNDNRNNTAIPKTKLADVKNINYTVNGETFTLVNGVASKEITPTSVTKNTLSIFGEPVYSDFNKDGLNDAAILLVNNLGGSGMFYYAALAIATGSTYTTTNTLLLGDRIAPQTINIEKGRAVYNYAERKANEPMTTRPSIGKSLYINYDTKTGMIGEWVKDFEGEADANKMSLGMKKWLWVKTQMNDGKVITPIKADAFTITFNKDGNATITTDCNSMGGTYTSKGNKLVFGPLMSTQMYCEGSQEGEFSQSLGEVVSYIFTGKGELVLEIKNDSGTMIFR